MDDEYAISLATTEYRDGINSGDLDRAMTAIAEGLTLMSDGEPSFWGKEGRDVLRWRWEHLIAENDVKLEVVLAILKVFGEYAFAWGWEIVDVTPKDGGQSYSLRNRYFEFWQKDSGQTWRIASFMTNKDLPPAMAAKEPVSNDF
jgi:ketosteroid isomerase-like protein